MAETIALLYLYYYLQGRSCITATQETAK